MPSCVLSSETLTSSPDISSELSLADASTESSLDVSISSLCPTFRSSRGLVVVRVVAALSSLKSSSNLFESTLPTKYFYRQVRF